MTTKELLTYVTPSAIEYMQKTVNSKNKADYEKLKKLFDDQRFEAKSFDDTDLDILAFDWKSLERDRNWWWQLQALPFLNWYVNSLALQSEEERNRYLSLCLDAIHCWVSNAKQDKKSPLVWHDHAAAFRVRNLTNWLLFCNSNGLLDNERIGAQPLAKLIIEHLNWLQDDKHYSKHTNHGFDQAMIALTIGLMFDHHDFDAYRQHNRQRLKDEVTFAFTDEGVHKENSPGYQKMMLGRLKQLRSLALLGEQKISNMGEHYIEKAEAFLRAITLPNGYLPMIGDTRGGDEGLPYEQKEKIDVLDYSKSGYVIVRGTVLEKELHLVFKA
ncbi:heparinase II/III family protein, partial [Halomonas sp. BC04]|uniref:heparinase II/III family protein n=1 Tax=Halomonas sp. BC04 TaxID=1403540 RepID=UPI0003ED5E64